LVVGSQLSDCIFFIEKLFPYENLESRTATAAVSNLESLTAILDFMEENNLEELIGETEIFIFPGYEFKLCNGIITNFHQPDSTLILLVAALVGENWRKIYDFALKNDFRFLSYGDSSLLFSES
jgi:S-adenosylmethionine:tRNA ribosyltransferase-isomerase